MFINAVAPEAAAERTAGTPCATLSVIKPESPVAASLPIKKEQISDVAMTAVPAFPSSYALADHVHADANKAQ